MGGKTPEIETEEKEESIIDIEEREKISGWTRIGRPRPTREIETPREPERPWLRQKKAKERPAPEDIKQREESLNWQRAGKEPPAPQVELEEKKQPALEEPKDEDIKIHRKLSEWMRVGPERPILQRPKKRPVVGAKREKDLTVDERLENLDFDEGMVEFFDDERFKDIAQRINRHKKWKRLKNIGRIKDGKR